MISEDLEVKRELCGTLAAPSTVHTFSILTEVVKEWFLSNFNNYFNNIHIEGKHVFDDFRKINFKEIMKQQRPILAIVPRIIHDFNRDMLDTNQFGADMLLKSGRLEHAFIQDFKRDVFLGSALKQIKLKYNFLIKVNSLAEQINLKEYMNLVFSIGHTSELNIDMDYHLPYHLMIQIANDGGFEVINNKIKDPVKFVNYINSISRLPIIFKYRTINGRMEFFVRYNDLDIIIDNRNMLSLDEGSSRGMLKSDYGIEMEIEIMGPTPKFFMYYSSNEHKLMKSVSSLEKDKSSVIYPIFTVNVEKIPNVNEKGWNRYLLTEYLKEDTDTEDYIDFSGLFEPGSDIERVVRFSKETNILPEEFIDIKLYNGTEYNIPFNFDWDTYHITFDKVYECPNYDIAIYIDTKYMMSTIKELDNMNRERVKLNK